MLRYLDPQGVEMDPHYFIKEDGNVNEDYENASYDINDPNSNPTSVESL